MKIIASPSPAMEHGHYVPRSIICINLYFVLFYRCSFNKNQYFAARIVQHTKFIAKTSSRCIGTASKAFIWNSIAAWYTGTGSNIISTKLAWRATRCCFSGFGWSVSLFALNHSLANCNFRFAFHGEKCFAIFKIQINFNGVFILLLLHIVMVGQAPHR